MMFSSSITMKVVFVLLVTAALVHGVRRGSSRRYKTQSRSLSARTQLLNLKNQLNTCIGRFMCQVVTVNNQCHVECIDEHDVCDGTMDCSNGRDEMTCLPGTECPSCPETSCPSCPETSCPSPTPCPECPEFGCPAGQISCNDGVTCLTDEQLCDGNADCPAGDGADENPNICGVGSCNEGSTSLGCQDTLTAPADITTMGEDVSGDACRQLCAFVPDCVAYGVGIYTNEGTCTLYETEPSLSNPINCDAPSRTIQVFTCSG